MNPLNSRRLIFLLLACVVVGTMLLPLETPPMVVNQETRDLYAKVDALQPGDPVLFSFDFDPSSKPELYPAARALLRHLFRKKVRLIALGLWQNGVGLANEALEGEAQLARLRDPQAGDAAYPVYGTDYVFLGWQPGQHALIVRMTEGIQGTFTTESRRKPTADLPIWTRGQRTVRALGDLSLAITISAGNPGIDEWIQNGLAKQKFDLAAAVTAVTAPGKMPFYKSGQIVGLLAGMRGAAEYEFLVNESDATLLGAAAPPPLAEALRGMNALSAAHFLIIILVVVSNVVYLTSRLGGRP